MRKILTSLLLTLMPLLLSAQENMAINSLFHGRLGKNNVSETIIKGEKVEEYGLDIYHSLSTKQPALAAKISRAVLEDAAKATSKEVKYDGDKLYYAFISIRDPRYNSYRHVLYLNNMLKGGKDVILIFMEGDANVQQVKRMLKK